MFTKKKLHQKVPLIIADEYLISIFKLRMLVYNIILNSNF